VALCIAARSKRGCPALIELEKILLPYFAAAMGARHGREVRGAFQTCCELGKGLKVASGPTAKIDYRKRPFALDVLQHWIGRVELVEGAAVPIRFGSRMDRELLTLHSPIVRIRGLIRSWL
jgi:hypothetical protein